jgi:hypothetical protein
VREGERGRGREEGSEGGKPGPRHQRILKFSRQNLRPTYILT